MLLKTSLFFLVVLFFLQAGQSDGLRLLKVLLGGDQDECDASQNYDWSYEGDNGADRWGDRYQDCDDNEQSPIDLGYQDAVLDRSLQGSLRLTNYDKPLAKATVQNTGETVYVKVSDKVRRTMTVGNTTYSLLQIHPHWGWHAHDGSEHAVNGRRAAMELHFVHQSSDGRLAVIGLLLEVDPRDNNALKPITELLGAIPFRGDSRQLRSPLQLAKLLGAGTRDFFRYAGSLTTPPCSEGVAWTVLMKRTYVGKRQLKHFRQLYSVTRDQEDDDCHMVGNVRPLQPINGRTIFRTT